MTLAGSDFNTVLAVYTGIAVNNLALVAFNDDCTRDSMTSCISFQVVPGTNYSIQVDGLADYGMVAVDVRFVLPPRNDFLSAAGTTFPTTGSTLNATLEPGEPLAGPGASGSVWYQFTASSNGEAKVRPRQWPVGARW